MRRQDFDDWLVIGVQEEDNDSNAVVAESALDRLACGLGGKTVFPHIMQLTPTMLQSQVPGSPSRFFHQGSGSGSYPGDVNLFKKYIFFLPFQNFLVNY